MHPAMPPARPAAPFGQAAPPAQSDSQVPWLPVAILAIYLFLVYSRVLEFVEVSGAILGTLLVVTGAALVTGDVRKVIASSTARWWFAYLGWFALTIVFSTYRGGSFNILFGRELHSIGAFFAIVALVTNRRAFNWMVAALAAANVFIGILGVAGPVRSLEDRLIVGYTTFADPNALSMYALFGLPFLWLWAQRLPRFARLLPLLAGVPVLYVFARAGSRGGMVALVPVLLYHFWKSSATTKVKLTLLTATAILAAVIVLPDYIQARLLTFFSVSQQSGQYVERLRGSDVASSESRRNLVAQAYAVTLNNPLFGVGAGNFGDFVYGGYKAGDNSFINTSTHNSFLQISSEMGVPALLFFCAAFLGCFFRKPLLPGEKIASLTPEQARSIHYMKLAMITLYGFAFSLSFAYDDIVMIGTGLMTACINIVQRERASAHQTRPVAVVPQAFAPSLNPLRGTGNQTSGSRATAGGRVRRRMRG